jgi:hypothetical protein
LAVDSREQLETQCRDVGATLRTLARELCFRGLSEEQFTAAVLKLEAERVSPLGLNLTASNTRDGWTVFTLRINGRKEPCSIFEFEPDTGEFRRAGSGPD